MKIWIGKEQEGIYKGELTMFVRSPVLLDWQKQIVFMLLNSYQNIKRLYIGAGRKDCTYIQDPVVFVNLCSELGIELIQEMDISNAHLITKEVASYGEVVLTSRDESAPTFFKNLTFKIDNFRDVILIQQGVKTELGLGNVVDNMYEEIDTVIYEDYK